MPDLEIPDTGFATIKVGDHEAVVDLYHAYCHLQAIRGKYGDQMTHAENIEFVEGVQAYLATVGFPGVSGGAALKLHNAVTAAGRDLLGNAPAGPTPGSPASTGSTSPDSPPAAD